MHEDNKRRRQRDEVYSHKMRAGKRTYFLDVHATESDDYYLTICESKKRADGSFEKHKIFLFKEDFNRFVAALGEVIHYVKTECLPDYDFDEFDRKHEAYYAENKPTEAEIEPLDDLSTRWED